MEEAIRDEGTSYHHLHPSDSVHSNAELIGAKEGDAFLGEFGAAGFEQAAIIRALCNARTKNPCVLASEVRPSR